ncbi:MULTISPECIES: YfhO family protein [unclassified Pedobacter]|uniref:YfhO family protein n=1 Tax=unclassified Pedobacter TaxID=2628915 RepID=UPI00224841AC|nr:MULTISPECIES: YfhO family protein [unclassified Pedobacter]MCX2432302.1 YfhO family protein [Pedobacter sp. GR22-10]MCX2582834.1 YfhO family protein [Pedobacter sp. MR22-3]
MNNWFNKNGIHLAIIAIFVVITFAYFSPVLQGKAPQQGDVLQAKAMQKEIMDVKAATGKGPLWTNQMFGGMPAYQIWVQYPLNITTYGIDVIKGVFPDPVGTVVLYLLGAYLLFCVLKINPWLAAAGAIAFAFTSYNFIIIAAGHSNKALAIGFFAPILAAIILTLRGRYLVGGSLFALFMALEIRSNHIQMTYYLFIALFILACIEFYHAFKAKQLATFGKSIGFIVAGMVLAVLVNAGTLWTTYEYGKETIRGKSNLTTDKAEPANGLDKEYAYQWSQGVGESFSFLIPNIYGGASSIDEMIKPESNTYKAVEKNLQGIDPKQVIGYVAQNLGTNQYWGNKPGTSGPYYFGAIICLLFVFGLFIVQHRWKWWILGSSILLLLLSFGQNFPLVSDIFFDYLPMYNKFRAVESILAVVGLLVPLLAVLAIKEAQEGKYDQKYLVKRLTWSAGITGGLSLIIAIIPTAFFSFTQANQPQVLDALTQALQNNRGAAMEIINGVIADRVSLARADAWRTLLFIVIGFGLTWAFITKKMNMQLVFGLLALFVLIDLWQVDRRYLNSQNFVSKTDLANHYQARDVDNFISADKDPNFRVFDLSLGDPFKSAETSYFHKTVGGFHSARLKRFQELVDHQMTKSINQDVLDMLNTKYIITQDPQNGSYKMQRNPTAAGNAWFVESVQFVKNADQEMKAISSFDAKKEAIVDESFKALIDSKILGNGQGGFIKLTDYHPDHLTYEYSTAKDVVAVFSEIYYNKGWKMYIDGVEKPYFRADYVLRAAQLEAGNHKLEFIFHPTSYYTGEKISLAGSILLLAGLGFGFYTEEKKKKKAVKV